MQPTNIGFIAKPHFFKEETKFKINDSKIEYTDVLTYVALRSFNNVQYNSCFPALETIASKAGVSKKFVSKSIERLEAAELITVLRSGKLRVGNRYSFRKFQYFDQIPTTFFSIIDLSLYEKSMLLCLREIALTPVDVIGTIKELSDVIGVTYKTLYCQLNSLIQKEYLHKERSNMHRLLKIDWNFKQNDNKPVSDYQFIIS